MNSYFASVEQQANPFLRGKPVGVCAYLSPNGCIIASSIEAKQKGVTVGMRAWEAKKQCPEIFLIQNDPEKYWSITEQIFRLLAQYSDRVEPYSIDEAFLDLTGWTRGDPLQYAYRTAQEIQLRIKKEIGEWLRCSIGISHTRWLAKFASDIASADSILFLSPKSVDEIFQKVSLTDAWGINMATANQLSRLGIHTLSDLKRASPHTLRQALGIRGYLLWADVNGIEREGITPAKSDSPKSFGHSYCLPKKTTDRRYLRPILMKLCEKTGRRLRKARRTAQRISVSIRYTSLPGYSKSKKIPHPISDSLSIYRQANEMLFCQPLPDRVVMIAVSVSDLVPEKNQLTLFPSSNALKKIARAMDAVNNRFGEFTVFYGEMLGTARYAPERIGYRKTLNATLRQ